MFLIFDTETTGLPDFKLAADAHGQPRLCSIAATLWNPDTNQCDNIDYLVRPDGWGDDVIAKAAGAFAINGLSVEKLQDEGRPIVEVLEAFDSLVDRCTGISAYGVSFDQKMVRAEQRRAGRPDRYGERPTFCVMEGARTLCNVKKRIKLAEAVRIALCEDLTDAHTARADLDATMRLFKKMLEKGIVEWRPQVSREAAQ